MIPLAADEENNYQSYSFQCIQANETAPSLPYVLTLPRSARTKWGQMRISQLFGGEEPLDRRYHLCSSSFFHDCHSAPTMNYVNLEEVSLFSLYSYVNMSTVIRAF